MNHALLITFCTSCIFCFVFAAEATHSNSYEGKNYETHTNDKNDKVIFEQLFNQWTEAFNQKDLGGACSLFAKTVKAKYRGLPQKNFDDICNGFAKIFNEKNKNYSYSFELQDVYRQGDLAVVRITWYLQIKENDMNKSIIQDEGFDVLEKNKKGEWQIVNYLAFPE